MRSPGTLQELRTSVAEWEIFGTIPWQRPCVGGGVAVRHFRDLIAWQLAESFKADVFRLVRESPRAAANQLFRDQLINAASAVGKDIAEGFLRCSPREFCRFIDYALGSLGEAELRLEDGIELDYFSAEDCQTARRYARRCLVAMIRLKQSQRQ